MSNADSLVKQNVTVTQAAGGATAEVAMIGREIDFGGPLSDEHPTASDLHRTALHCTAHACLLLLLLLLLLPSSTPFSTLAHLAHLAQQPT